MSAIRDEVDTRLYWRTTQPPIKVRLLRSASKAPRYMTAGAAGADVFADLGADGEFDYLERGRTRKVGLGFAVEIPTGWVGLLKGRSGLAMQGHECHVAAIDSDYRGEVSMIVHCSADAPVPLCIEHGQRIGQILFVPAPQFEIVVVDELSETVRGQGGFGSSGMR